MKDSLFSIPRISRGLWVVTTVLTVQLTLAAEAPPPVQWQQNFGGSGADNFFSVLPTSDGGFLLGGESDSDVSGNKTSAPYGATDVWLVKVDADGSKVWDKSFGGSGNDRNRMVAATIDGGFVMVGHSTSGVSGNKTSVNYGGSDFWLVKVDASGTELWDQSFGGTDDDGQSILVPTEDGGFLLGGFSRSGVSGNKTATNYGDYDVWLVMVDANGNKLWDRSFGGSGREGDAFASPLTIASAGDGGFLIGAPSASRRSGNKTSASYGGADYWLFKVDANGDKLWEQTYGGRDDDILFSLAPTPDYGYLLAGESRSGISGNKGTPNYGLRDCWLVKVDLSGNKLWEKNLGGEGEDPVVSIASAADGTFLLGGWLACYPLCGDFDFWLVKVDASGDRLWEQSFGATGANYFAVDVLKTIVSTGDGGFLLAGSSNSDISGSKTSPNYGDYDFWVIKLAGPPKLLIQRSGSGVSVSWPASATGFSLEATSALLLGAAWSPVMSDVVTQGDRLVVTHNVNAGNAFYRLRKP